MIEVISSFNNSQEKKEVLSSFLYSGSLAEHINNVAASVRSNPSTLPIQPIHTDRQRVHIPNLPILNSFINSPAGPETEDLVGSILGPSGPDPKPVKSADTFPGGFRGFYCPENLVQAYADWISPMMPWQWYLNLTFKKDVHPEAADKRWSQFVTTVNRALYGKHYFEGVPWVRAMELQRRGVIHFHALMSGGVNLLNQFIYNEIWYHPDEDHENGIARIFSYDPKRGAVWYLSKYNFKGGQIDLFLPKHGLQTPLGR